MLEGVAFGLADGLDLVSDLAGGRRRARLRRRGEEQLWLEIVASVLDLPLEVTAVDEGAAYGAALLGGVAAGTWSDPAEAAEACVRVTRRIEPRPDWVAALRGAAPGLPRGLPRA